MCRDKAKVMYILLKDTVQSIFIMTRSCWPPRPSEIRTITAHVVIKKADPVRLLLYDCLIILIYGEFYSLSSFVGNDTGAKNKSGFSLEEKKS